MGAKVSCHLLSLGLVTMYQAFFQIESPFFLIAWFFIFQYHHLFKTSTHVKIEAIHVFHVATSKIKKALAACQEAYAAGFLILGFGFMPDS